MIKIRSSKRRHPINLTCSRLRGKLLAGGPSKACFHLQAQRIAALLSDVGCTDDLNITARFNHATKMGKPYLDRSVSHCAAFWLPQDAGDEGKDAAADAASSAAVLAENSRRPGDARGKVRHFEFIL